MLESAIWLTIGLAVLAMGAGFQRWRDPFHPLVFTMPMYVAIYGYLPLKLINSGELFAFVSGEQAEFAQWLAVAILAAFVAGCWHGSSGGRAYRGQPTQADPGILFHGAVGLGGIGMAAWLFMLAVGGGLSGFYGAAYGGSYYELGYVRDAVYLLLVAILILLSPTVYARRNALWWAAAVSFALPWILQALLGARRGPTFVLVVAVGVSWYMARGRRPSLTATLSVGTLVGLLMLFLVANRSSIHLGSDFDLDTERMKNVLDASEANEYIFGTGCIAAVRQTEAYFWGKRLLAQVLVRPIPRQLWPTKYVDFGVAELERNAGVATSGLQSVMGWKEVPGAAAAMVADMWVEFSWGAIPVAGVFGWVYGRCWLRAKQHGAMWITQYVILLMLSVYLITQGLEAVFFRLLILSIPSRWLWHRAACQPSDIATIPMAHAR